MAELFKKIVGNPTAEEKEKMIKTGVIPTQYKNPESKRYITLLKSDLDIELCFGLNADAWAIIEIGREAMFDRIIEILNGYEDISNSSINNGIFNLDESEVLVEGVEAGSSVSLKQFIIMCNKAYPDKDFDIDYYLLLNKNADKPNYIPDATGLGTSGTILD